MQYTSIFLAALAATTTLAAPRNPISTNNKLQVILSGPAVQPSTNILRAGKRISQPPSSSTGPFITVELRVGANVQKQDYRCQILDQAQKPIIIQRGANTDTTFADGDKGAWTIKNPSTVSAIICDPTFVKASSSDSEIRVKLSNQRIELGVQQTFTGDVREEKFVASGPFTTVEIEVGALVQKQDTRCQVVDKAGKPIVATRGANTDITFADGDKGEWKFERESEVSKVICDPAFVAGGAA